MICVLNSLALSFDQNCAEDVCKFEGPVEEESEDQLRQGTKIAGKRTFTDVRWTLILGSMAYFPTLIEANAGGFRLKSGQRIVVVIVVVAIVVIVIIVVIVVVVGVVNVVVNVAVNHCCSC